MLRPWSSLQVTDCSLVQYCNTAFLEASSQQHLSQTISKPIAHKLMRCRAIYCDFKTLLICFLYHLKAPIPCVFSSLPFHQTASSVRPGIFFCPSRGPQLLDLGLACRRHLVSAKPSDPKPREVSWELEGSSRCVDRTF